MADRLTEAALMGAGGIGSLLLAGKSSEPVKTSAEILGYGLIGFGILNLIGGIGVGTGTEEDPDAAPPANQPLQVRIVEREYLINGRAVPLERVLELAQTIQVETGPQVVITRDGTSRAGTENAIEVALAELGITWQGIDDF